MSRAEYTESWSNVIKEGFQMKPSSIIRAVLLGVCVATLGGCGKSASSIFKNATFTVVPQNGDEYLQLEVDINSSNIIFSGLTIPIISHSQVIGDVGVSTNLSTGTSAMVVQVDLTKVLKVPNPTLGGILPNGLPWPVTGVNLGQMMSFAVGSSGSRVYLYYDPTAKKAMLGAALDVSALNIGTPATLFSTFSQSGINGLVGLYTGKTANTSGVGFLADVSSKMSFPAALSLHREMVRKTKPVQRVQFYSTSPKTAVRRKIDRVLYRLNESHARITIH